MNYVSLIIDIEKSRMYAIDDRNELQHFLVYCVDKLNELFHSQIEHRVIFSAGDELQGLFRDVTVAVLYFRLLEILAKPVKLRAGIGIGEWTIKIDKGLSTEQDGPVYHKARYAIEEVYGNSFHNIRICSDVNDVMANHLLNASRPLKNQQIYMQNIVQVILELICPFVKKGIDYERYRIVKELVEIKFGYAIGRTPKSRIQRYVSYKDEVLYIPEYFLVEPIYIDGELDYAEKRILVKNISSYIGEILGCSRQNVDTILKRGNANKIRELDYMALQYIERTYGK